LTTLLLLQNINHRFPLFNGTRLLSFGL